MLDKNHHYRRTVLKAVCSGLSVSQLSLVAGASKSDKNNIVHLSRKYGDGLDEKTIINQQKSGNFTPLQIPEFNNDGEVVEFISIKQDEIIRNYFGIAYNEGSVEEIRRSALNFLEEEGSSQQSVGTSSHGIESSEWDGTVLDTVEGANRPAGKIRLHVTWKYESDWGTHGIVSDTQQIPGQNVPDWNANLWSNGYCYSEQQFDKGEFDTTVHDYGPRGSGRSGGFSFSIGPAPPYLSVEFFVQSGASVTDNSDTTLPRMHWLLNSHGQRASSSTVSMLPASTTFINTSQIDNSRQHFTTLFAKGRFFDHGCFIPPCTATASTGLRLILP